MAVREDGAGGPDAEGSGPAGLRGRVAAIDGMGDVRSPHGRDRGAAVRVVLAEDSTLPGEALARLLTEEGREVPAPVGDAGAPLSEAAAHEPNLVVTDIRMPPTHKDEGLRAAVEIRRRRPDIGVLVLFPWMERAHAAQSLAPERRAGNSLLRDRVAQAEVFLVSLERIDAGGAAFGPYAVRQLVTRGAHGDPLSRLTPRERTALEAPAQGHADAAIAQQPHISLSAVEKNLNAVFDKPGPAHTTGHGGSSPCCAIRRCEGAGSHVPVGPSGRVAQFEYHLARHGGPPAHGPDPVADAHQMRSRTHDAAPVHEACGEADQGLVAHDP